MTYFTTADHLNDCNIIAASTAQEAFDKSGIDQKEWVLLGSEILTGDCWVKFYREPKQDYLEHLAKTHRVDPADLYVRHPGTHPGGNAYWVDIKPGVETLIIAPVEA